MQIAGSRDQLDVVKCLLVHGADAGVVDLDACAEEAQALLREALHGDDDADDAAQVPRSGGELVRARARARARARSLTLTLTLPGAALGRRAG